MMKQLLAHCIEGNTLSEGQAEQVMNEIMSGHATPSQIASLVSIMRLRGETVDELVGFARSMKKHMVSIEYPHSVVDTCGTGGDGASTFNISTAAAIVTSSLGVKVAKHGNRAVSSSSGSADVLEKLGLSIQISQEEAIKSLNEQNMSFLFAPMFHSSMKHAVNPRKEIGFRTVFNLLGPLSNPANAKRQVIGVFSTDYAEKMAEALKRLGSEHVLLVTGKDGLDEISISTETDIVELKNGEISRYILHPKDVGLFTSNQEGLLVKNAEESAKLIEEIFNGKGPESAENIVAINAGAALYVANYVQTIEMGVLLAKETIQNGKALQQLKDLRSYQREENYA
ncbi:anthranilate phosphoribosyltransferase [Bacillus weihaiensis]|uniref:Anthranilate phosphoribosyltransferase n=1 Tax=Bacillus weihaiensis TaxID=1547283 RepID=A0A1L3MQT8_9BACI|nr:anthranilate phosphoribosyltransferase [Bacillus weihaiensis]APH04604.1 anthranilate phosphoribosyltransferase [Bacillus weihaiensis]